MKICTFFGHRDAPETVAVDLRAAMVRLIEEQGVSLFYVGNQGRFDGMVRRILRELKERYPIRYAVVLAYLPRGKGQREQDFSDTLLPQGIEEVHPRFAIDRCNRWMVEQSTYVITYVRRSYGGAAKFAKHAEKKKKTIIKL